MRLRQILSLVVFFVLAISAVGQVRSSDPIDAVAHEIGRGLQCQCSCGSTIADCNMLYCHYGEPVRAEIREGLLAGLTPDVIVDQLAAKYGAIILGAPSTEGFGAVGWAMPFVMILLGLLVVPLVIRRWRNNQLLEGALAPASAPVDSATLSRLEAEIERDLASEE
jgi:cytochrome c-type biogenesis protein CcmH/NrfF